MTDQQFWMKLDSLAGKSDSESIMALARLFRKGYEENLMIPIACHHVGLNMIQQMYTVIDPKQPMHDGSRYMLCYTSLARAEKDPTAKEPWEKVPVRFVIDNAMNKAVIGGVVFNQYDPKNMSFLPKQFLGGGEMMQKALIKLLQYPAKGLNAFFFTDEK